MMNDTSSEFDLFSLRIRSAASTLLAVLLLSMSQGVLNAQPPEEEVEIIVNVLPKKGMKFDRGALYREDQEVIQGVIGSSGADEVAALAIMQSGHILMAGTLSAPDSALADRPRLGCSEPGVSAGPFLAVLDPHFRELIRVAYLPSVFTQIQHIEIADDGSVFLGGPAKQKKDDGGLAVVKLPPKLDQLIWETQVRGTNMSGMTILRDQTVVVAPNQNPFISRIAADGSGTLPFGEKPYFRTDGANPDVRQAWWFDQQFPEAGVTGVTYFKGNSGGIGATRDGNLVFLTSNFVRHSNGSPDFDPMLIKFTLEGEVLWATHLLEALPALSDHKSPHLYICPYSGDIIATMRQHGHFSDNLVVGPKAYLKTDNWLTGNIMIGWIGRIDPDTGRVKAGTMYFPDLGRAPEGGKRSANSLMPSAVRTDPEGNIYVTGIAAHKLDTTIHAFQSEKMGDSGFISVFDPSLEKLRYANLITGHGYNYDPRTLVITERGPLVASLIKRKPEGTHRARLIHSNTDKTNFLSEDLKTETGILFSLLPSAPWRENW